MTSPLSLVFADTSDMPVLHPLDARPLCLPDGRPQWIRLAGIDSPQFRRALAEIQARRGAREEGADAEDDFAVELIGACTLDWLIEGEDGAELPYSPEAARTLYRRLPWLRRQCDRHMADRERYLGEG